MRDDNFIYFTPDLDLIKIIYKRIDEREREPNSLNENYYMQLNEIILFFVAFPDLQ